MVSSGAHSLTIIYEPGSLRRPALLHHPSSQVIHVSFPPQARDVYEEAIQTVTTVRDFGQVFDVYAQFEESMISAKMETAAEMGTSEEGVCVGVFCEGVCIV